MNIPTPPPSAPTGMVLVPVAFLRALLHDSSCPFEPFSDTSPQGTKDPKIKGNSDVFRGCASEDHGMSFTELRETYTRAVNENSKNIAG